MRIFFFSPLPSLCCVLMPYSFCRVSLSRSHSGRDAIGIDYLNTRRDMRRRIARTVAKWKTRARCWLTFCGWSKQSEGINFVNISQYLDTASLFRWLKLISLKKHWNKQIAFSALIALYLCLPLPPGRSVGRSSQPFRSPCHLIFYCLLLHAWIWSCFITHRRVAQMVVRWLADWLVGWI